MPNLRIDYDSIERSIIPAMKRYEQDINALNIHMEKTVKSLSNYMEAEAANAYYAEFDNVMSVDVKKLEELIVEYYTQLQQVVERFEDLDAELAGMIII